MRILCGSSLALTQTSTECETPELDAQATKSTCDHQLHTAMIGQQLESDYHVHELPDHESTTESCTATISAALLARIEMLEAENTKLKSHSKDMQCFRIECIEHDDNLVCFYTAFVSYTSFMAFFDFLGPVVNQLHYWGSREGDRQRKHSRKLDPKNQLF